jgi:hypothetical protein
MCVGQWIAVLLRLTFLQGFLRLPDSSAHGQAATGRRRRRSTPTMPKPAISSAQVTGSD